MSCRSASHLDRRVCSCSAVVQRCFLLIVSHSNFNACSQEIGEVGEIVGEIVEVGEIIGEILREIRREILREIRREILKR